MKKQNTERILDYMTLFIFILLIGMLVSIIVLDIRCLKKKEQYKLPDKVEVIDRTEKEKRIYIGNVIYDEENNKIVVRDSTMIQYEDLSHYIE